jgi:ATP-dependent RNA helicase DeaD
MEQIAKKFSIPMVEHQVPTDEELETLISQRAVFLLESRLRKADNIQKERMQRFLRTVGELAANEDSPRPAGHACGRVLQATFHAPLEQRRKRWSTWSVRRLPRPGRPVRPRVAGPKAKKASPQAFAQKAGNGSEAAGRPQEPVDKRSGCRTGEAPREEAPREEAPREEAPREVAPAPIPAMVAETPREPAAALLPESLDEDSGDARASGRMTPKRQGLQKSRRRPAQEAQTSAAAQTSGQKAEASGEGATEQPAAEPPAPQRQARRNPDEEVRSRTQGNG